jgi:Sec-independent protein translocase protein TatA
MGALTAIAGRPATQRAIMRRPKGRAGLEKSVARSDVDRGGRLMSTNLVALVSNMLTPDLINRIASALGLDPALVNKAVSAAVPALLGTLAGATSKPDGAGRLFETVSSMKPDSLGDLAAMIGGGGQQGLVDSGIKALGGILGGQGVDGLAGAISKVAGLQQGQASSLVGMLAPAVLGALGSQARSGGLDGGGLARMLADQAPDIAKAMPPGLSGALSGTGLLGGLESMLGSATGAAGAAAGGARATAQAAAKTVQSAAGSAQSAAQAAGAAANRAATGAKPSGMPGWAPWALGLLVLVLIGWWLFGGRTDEAVQEAASTAEQATEAAKSATDAATTAVQQATDAASTAVEQATDAASTAVQQATDAASTAVEQATDAARQLVASLPELTVGGVDIAATANDAMAGLESTLGSVTDVESAKAALPKLDDVSAKLGTIEGALAQVPATGRTALADALAKVRPQIDAAFDQALAIPGVAEVVKPAIDAIRAKLDAIAKPA